MMVSGEYSKFVRDLNQLWRPYLYRRSAALSICFLPQKNKEEMAKHFNVKGLSLIFLIKEFKRSLSFELVIEKSGLIFVANELVNC